MSYDNLSTLKKKKKKKSTKPLGRLKLSGGNRPLNLTIPLSPNTPSKKFFKNRKKISPPPSPLQRFFPERELSPSPTIPTSQKPLKPVDLVWVKDMKLSLSADLTNVLVEDNVLCVGTSKGLSIWDWSVPICEKVIKTQNRCVCVGYYPKFWLLYMEYGRGIFLLNIQDFKVYSVLNAAITIYPDSPFHNEKIRIPRPEYPSTMPVEELLERQKNELPDLFLTVKPENRGIDVFIIPVTPFAAPRRPKSNVPGYEKQGGLYVQHKVQTMKHPSGNGDLRNPTFLPASQLLLAVTRSFKQISEKNQTESKAKNAILIYDVKKNLNHIHSLVAKSTIVQVRHFYNPRRHIEDLVTFSEEGIASVWNLKEFTIERHVQIVRDVVSMPYQRNTYIMTSRSSTKDINFFIHLQTEKRRVRKHHLQIWEFINAQYEYIKKEDSNLMEKRVVSRRRVKRWGKKKTDNRPTRHTDILWLDEEKWVMGVLFERRLSMFKLVDRRLSENDLRKARMRVSAAQEDLNQLRKIRPKMKKNQKDSSSSRMGRKEKLKPRRSRKVRMKVGLFDDSHPLVEEDEVFRVMFIHQHLKDILTFKYLLDVSI